MRTPAALEGRRRTHKDGATVTITNALSEVLLNTNGNICDLIVSKDGDTMFTRRLALAGATRSHKRCLITDRLRADN